MEKVIMSMMMALIMMVVMTQVVQASQQPVEPVEPEEPEAPPPTLANLYGFVVDSTGQPIEDVLVTLDSHSAHTNSSGRYEFTGIEPGIYAVRFEKEGYGTIATEATLAEGNNKLDAALTAVGAEFYMPPAVDISIWEHDILRWHYHQITYSVTITNRGNAPGTHIVRWQVMYDATLHRDAQFSVSLNPGESYDFTYKFDIDFSRINFSTCKLWGDWLENNYSEGRVVEGVPV